MDDNQVFGTDFISFYQPTYRITAQVHHGLRSGQYHLYAGNFTFTNPGMASLVAKAYSMLSGQSVQAHETYVVSVVGVDHPRVTQAND
jgi:hypothetical protein